MSVSGLKAELKFLASIFDKNHERFRIVSWKLDELHCQFLVPPPGSPHSPPPPLTLHCNITVRRPGAAPLGPARAETGAPSPRTKGSLPRRGLSAPLSPARGPGQALRRLRESGVGGGGRRVLRLFPRGSALGLLAPLGPCRRSPRWETTAAGALAGSP